MSKLVHVYRTRIPNSKFIFKNGTVANFTGDRYITDKEGEVAELDAEIAARHPQLYVVPGQETADPSDLDPELVYRKKIIAEFLAGTMDASGNPKRDMGTSAQGQIKPASSLNIAPITAGQGVATFALPQTVAQTPATSGLATALGLLTPQADSATHVPAAGSSADPDVVAGLNALAVFGG